ncbi:GNAT family acetyltransferase [Kushneria phosphatilytica]|uniref:GNAT family acetyltransferase n=1 Tax=Kushneria phosphatilytica TaxID=657387 RepID=A0A1S1NZ94_9GAMM|nr:GNAT family acetyltransferase [Kushneria phosphatilytica]OHV13804.1 GNAT family acetyltransferase [Kushneria phosphatilytica]QEL12708.1 GNAT family acetyltransferase [Kushneria phosphatilytica]
MQLRPYRNSDEVAVIQLWQRCALTRPWNDPHRDIARKCAEDPSLFLIGTIDEQVMASAMAGYDGHRGWLYYLAVAPERQGRGFGRALIEAVESLLIARGCPKLMMMVRPGQPRLIDYYHELGYETGEFTTLGKRLVVDE